MALERRFLVASALAALLTLTAASCPKEETSSKNGSSKDPETTPSPDAASSPASEVEDPAFVVTQRVADDGSKIIELNPSAWNSIFAGFNENNGDPLHQIHSEGHDNFYFAIELYTKFGPQWTGQSGTFPTNCTTHGICPILDLDGKGPLAPLRARDDGEIDIRQIEGGYDLTVRNLHFPAGDETYLVEEVDFKV